MHIRELEARRQSLISEYQRVTSMVQQGQQTANALQGAIAELNFWMTQAQADVEPSSPPDEAPAGPDKVIELDERRPRFRKTWNHEQNRPETTENAENPVQ